ncbi:MAG: integration host factor [Actinomycetaceae bacterium]|nr:integration host factor [Actinomycetaceae bacterium]
MPLPKLTPEQRAAALEKASAARRARAELKKEVKEGKVTLSEVLKKADGDKIIANMKVSALLGSLPGIGAAKSKQIMEKIGISDSRRLGGLGPHQKEALIERFG